MMSWRLRRSARTSGAKTTLRATPAGLQAGRVVRLQGGADLVGRERPARIGLHGIIGRGDRVVQPALDRGVALVEGPEASADHFAGQAQPPPRSSM